MKFSALLAAIGLAPANLEQAKATREAAAATLTKVNAMFYAAKLDLEKMLEAGEDSLKAHLASLDQSETIATLTKSAADAKAALETATAQLAKDATRITELTAVADSRGKLLASLGLDVTQAVDEKSAAEAFKAHVEKQAAAVLAKDGRPPVSHVSKDALKEKPAASAQLTDAEHLAAWEKLPEGSKERADYAAKHYDALMRAASSRDRAA